MTKAREEYMLETLLLQFKTVTAASTFKRSGYAERNEIRAKALHCVISC
jgi:hypothetical protein